MAPEAGLGSRGGINKEVYLSSLRNGTLICSYHACLGLNGKDIWLDPLRSHRMVCDPSSWCIWRQLALVTLITTSPTSTTCVPKPCFLLLPLLSMEALHCHYFLGDSASHKLEQNSPPKWLQLFWTIQSAKPLNDLRADCWFLQKESQRLAFA